MRCGVTHQRAFGLGWVRRETDGKGGSTSHSGKRRDRWVQSQGSTARRWLVTTEGSKIKSSQKGVVMERMIFFQVIFYEVPSCLWWGSIISLSFFSTMQYLLDFFTAIYQISWCLPHVALFQITFFTLWFEGTPDFTQCSSEDNSVIQLLEAVPWRANRWWHLSTPRLW